MAVHKVKIRGRSRWRARVCRNGRTLTAFRDRKRDAQLAERELLDWLTEPAVTRPIKVLKGDLDRVLFRGVRTDRATRTWLKKEFGHGAQVYVIRSENFLKIGVSLIPGDRLYELQVGNPVELELIGLRRFEEDSRDLERALHADLQKFCVRGEWFYDNEPVREVLRRYDVVFADEVSACPACGEFLDFNEGDEYCELCDWTPEPPSL